MNLNAKQWLAIAGAILGALAVSSTQLTEIFGPTAAKSVTAAVGLLSMILNSVLVALTGQASMVKDVAAMEGMEPIRINRDANSTLASLAVDPGQPNIGPKAEDRVAVSTIANANQ